LSKQRENEDLVLEGGVDLHCHSTASDGEFSPSRLITLAEEAGLEALALTDHDTVAGLDEFMRAAQSSPVEAVPGLEISAENSVGRFHILGYYLDWQKPRLIKKLQYYEEARAERVRKMIDILEDKIGAGLTFEDVANLAGKKLIGKPHVAQAMFEKGIVSSVRQAFDEYLAHGRILDRVPKKRMGVSEAITLLEEAGGVISLAHPLYYAENFKLRRFSVLGVEALEVYYSDHNQQQEDKYKMMALSDELLITGGTDFHGSVKPEVKLGDLRLKYEHLEKLKKVSRRKGGRFDIV